MIEHTSQGLSQRLHDKGFRGEHTNIWGKHPSRGLWTLCKKENIGFHPITFPAYTFTELWNEMDWKHRRIVDRWIHEGENPSESAGEYILMCMENDEW